QQVNQHDQRREQQRQQQAAHHAEPGLAPQVADHQAQHDIENQRIGHQSFLLIWLTSFIGTAPYSTARTSSVQSSPFSYTQRTISSSPVRPLQSPASMVL